MQNDSNSTNTMIRFDAVTKTYPNGVTGLRNMSFSVQEGEFVCIIGPSGGGKTTLLKLIAGLEDPTTGSITRPKELAEVFQSYALLPWLRAIDNVAFGLRARGISDSKALPEAYRYLQMMGLRGFENAYPRELSGGQRQRVGIARAFAVRPHVLLLDEPFSALDPKITQELHTDLLKIWTETKKTIVMVSHSIEEAVELADRIILIKDFTLSETFTISVHRPRHEQASDFIQDVVRVRREFFK